MNSQVKVQAAINCPSCGSDKNDLKEGTIKYKSPMTQKQCKVKGVPYHLCQNCKEEWQTPAQFKIFQMISTQIDRKSIANKQG